MRRRNSFKERSTLSNDTGGWRGRGENNGFNKMDIIKDLFNTSFCAIVEKECPIGALEEIRKININRSFKEFFAQDSREMTLDIRSHGIKGTGLF